MGSLSAMISCAAPTLHGNLQISALSDFQLIEELTSALTGVGVTTDRAAYLMAIRPEPAYVLTSSSTVFSGTVNTTFNAYAMPVGYGAAVYGSTQGTVTGVASTQYRYADVNATARLANSIAQSIYQAKQKKCRQRAEAVWQEYQGRAARRRQEMELLITSFFDSHPELNSRRMLVAAIAPWVAAEGASDPRNTLEKAGQLATSLRRGEGVTGPWYGMFSQTSRLDNGETVGFSQFVRLELSQIGNHITGKGLLGSGEVIELTGQADGARMTAAVANTTSAINVSLSAVAAPSQITGEFAGAGVGQRIAGTVVLLR